VIYVPQKKILVGQILLAESHIAVHFELERMRAFIDIFTCGCMEEGVVGKLCQELPITNMRLLSVERGLEYMPQESHRALYVQADPGVLVGLAAYSR
jgi:S-adenosylmethionine/arginine decarboxylase-like enzyme